MVELEPDEAVTRDIEKELAALEKEIGRRQIDLLFSDPYTDHVALIGIHAGAGGTDSQDWAQMLLRMYLLWAEQHRMPVEFLEESVGDEAGIKSATIRVSGPRAYGLLKGEHGVHRLVRISPFDAAKRRHTSFASVFVYPQVDDTVEVEIKDGDLRIDTFRASGAGGQHVNKTSSAVRITHLPSGLVVSCQSERSQHRNRESAMKILKARLYVRQRAEERKKMDALFDEQKEIAWGNQIRSYVFQPYTMVKDHRTGCETSDVGRVMNGDLNPFIDAYLRKR
jgi:peptide chain release factor 2